MRYVVIKAHTSNYPTPITLEKGEEVLLGRKSEEGEWPNWIYCSTLDRSMEGWVPEQVLCSPHSHRSLVKEQYNARELNVIIGSEVRGFKKLNGWIWCSDSEGEKGWLPESHLKQID